MLTNSRLAPVPSSSPTAIAGVICLGLNPHPDERGSLTEAFRREWPSSVPVVQWNLVRSRRHVLRGVHVHVRHEDYLVVATGTVTFGLADLRPDSVTAGVRCTLRVSAADALAIVIPPGVAHGFYMHTATIQLYGVTRYWDNADELGVRWDDAELAIPWPAEAAEPIVSPRDRELPALAALLPALAAGGEVA